MKPFRRFLLFFVAMGSMMPLLAQTPGYLGKTFYIGYELAAMPALSGDYRIYNYSLRSSADGFPGIINSSHKLGVGWTVSRRTVLTFSSNLYRSAARLNSSYYDNNYLKMKGISGEFGLRLFPFNRRGFVAPLGTYTELAVRGDRITNVQVDEQNNVKQEGTPFYDMAFVFGTGRTWVIWDKLLINLGWKFNVYWRIDPYQGPLAGSVWYRVQSSQVFFPYLGVNLML